MRAFKKVLRVITVTVAVAAFIFTSVQFAKDLKALKKGTQKALKYKISYSYNTDNDEVFPDAFSDTDTRQKVDPARVDVLKVKFNIAIAEYLTSIAVIAIISTPLILITRRKSKPHID